MHEAAERNAQRFLAFADRLFGSRLLGFYVVGSAALGGFLAEHGIAMRGPRPAELGLDPEPHLLRQWNLENLNGY